MGTAVGINCVGCGNQLNYDYDCSQITKHTQIDNNLHMSVVNQPILCNSCEKVIQNVSNFYRMKS